MLKLLCPHIYLTKPSPNVNSFLLRVITPLAFNYDEIQVEVPSTNEDMEEFVITIKFGSKTNTAAENPDERDLLIIPNPLYWPTNPKYVVVKIYESIGPLEQGNLEEKGRSILWFSDADNKELTDESPCMFLTKSNTMDLNALYTIIPLNGTHALEKVVKEEPSENEVVGLSFNVENGGNGNSEYPLRNVQFIQLSAMGTNAIESVVYKGGEPFGKGKMQVAYADDKNF